MNLARRVETGHISRRAKDVGHQGATSGAKFCQGERAWLALVDPGLRQTQADHLAEHLADLGGGGEIARSAQWIARCVIAVLWVQKAGGHILRHSHWAMRRYLGFQDLSQLCHACAARRLAKVIRPRPIAIIGTDRICPMVRP